MQVYVAHSLVDDKLYVGQTRSKLNVRRHGHASSAKRGCKGRFMDAIRRDGIASMDFFIVQECSTQDELNATERLWIILLGTLSPDVGHNICSGTEWHRALTGSSPSAETRAKVSSSMKGIPRHFSPEHRASVIAANKARAGSKLTNEHRAKCSLALRGRKLPPRTSEHCAKLSAVKMGVKHTPESNSKRSATQKGRPHSEQHRLKLALANKARALRERAERA